MERSSRKERELRRIRHDILLAAARAFTRGGYQGTTMEAIAKEAGYAASSLYTYFSGKDEIYRALLTTVGEAFDDADRDSMLPTLPFPGRLEWLIRKRFEVVERHIEPIILFLAHRPTFDGGIDSTSATLARERYAKLISNTAELLVVGMDEGVVRRGDAQQLAILVNGVLNAAVLSWIGGEHGGSLQSMVPMVLELVLHGIASGEVQR